MDARLDEYKRGVASAFDRRSNSYDASDRFHRWLAERLVELADLRGGQRVLDVATGTGMVAIPAARIVGTEGQVIGVDISEGMVHQARRKVQKEGLNNVEVMEGDAEILDFEAGSFDAVLCSSAMAYMSDIPGALRRWRGWIRDGGIVAFNCLGAESTRTSAVFRDLVKEDCGIEVPDPNEPLDSPEKCRDVLQKSGFGAVEVKTEQAGFTTDDAEAVWEANLRSAFNSEVLKLPPEKLEALEARYRRDVQTLATPDGIEDTIVAQFVLGRK